MLLGSEEILKRMEEKQREIQALAGILVDRAEIEIILLERVALVVNNQALNIFLFLLKNGPATRRQLKMRFPSSTVDRYMTQLEAVEAVEHRSYKYHVKRKQGN